MNVKLSLLVGPDSKWILVVKLCLVFYTVFFFNNVAYIVYSRCAHGLFTLVIFSCTQIEMPSYKCETQVTADFQKRGKIWLDVTPVVAKWMERLGYTVKFHVYCQFFR